MQYKTIIAKYCKLLQARCIIHLKLSIMKKVLFAAITVLATIVLSPAVFAADGQLVSGPSGTQVNGWYSTNPTMRVNTIPNCPSGPSGNFNMIIINEEGQHHITLRSHKNGYPRIYRDDDVNGHGTSNEVFSCPSISTPYDGSDPEVFWQGDIKWDGTNPTISLSSPSNNSNTDSSSVKVTGSVGDSTSGVWKVVINGVSASVGGGSFSASVPVNNGLNTLTATVYDYAGNTAQTQVVVNRVSSCGGTCSASSGSSNQQSSNSGSGSNNSGQSQAENNSQPQSSEHSQEQTSQDQETPTLVKGVVKGGGIGLATVLAFVVILLLLDRFRIIEIKAFSKISDKLSKNKTQKKATKKSS